LIKLVETWNTLNYLCLRTYCMYSNDLGAYNVIEKF